MILWNVIRNTVPSLAPLYQDPPTLNLNDCIQVIKLQHWLAELNSGRDKNVNGSKEFTK